MTREKLLSDKLVHYTSAVHKYYKYKRMYMTYIYIYILSVESFFYLHDISSS